MSDYQVIVIGAGPGGYVCAIKCARLGLKTAIVEGRDIGGTCLNRGCIPTKSLLHSAEAYHALTHSEALGITATEVGFDFAKIHAKKAEVVTKLRTGVEGLLAANKIDIIRGMAIIEGQGQVRVGEQLYACDSIVIATGSTPARPPIPGLELQGVVTSDELLEGTDTFDQSLVIIGGGVIGVEFASVYADLADLQRSAGVRYRAVEVALGHIGEPLESGRRARLWREGYRADGAILSVAEHLACREVNDESVFRELCGQRAYRSLVAELDVACGIP